MKPEGSWFAHRTIGPRARMRLFCFPYAGAGASLFRLWAREMPDEIEVCPVQLPGREFRWAETPYARIEPLVQALSVALTPDLGLPYALFGHSMGALIAFELARALAQRGTPPLHVIVAARRGPQRPDPRPWIHALPADDFIRELAVLKGVPNEFLQDHEALDCYLPALRADFALCETYRYRPDDLLVCPLTVYGASQDHAVSQEDLEAWRDETTSSCRIRSVEGDHYFIRSNPELLARATAADLSVHMSEPPAFDGCSRRVGQADARDQS